MTIKIIAVAPEDGWAFILKGDRIFLLRPPYFSSSQIEVSEKAVETAVSSLGFERSDATFDGISEVVRYLKETYVKSMKDQGIVPPSSEKLKRILKYAPDKILLEYLDKAKNELIPEGKISVAASLAFDFIKLEKVKNNLEMLEKAVEILEVWHERELQKERLVFENLSETWVNKFPNAVKRYSIDGLIKRQRAISKRGQLLYLKSGGA